VELGTLTTTDAPFYLTGVDPNPNLLGFHEACVEHHLRLRSGWGGLVEEAVAARRPLFCADVTKYSMDVYPQAHHARFYELSGCLAVCARLRRGGDESMDTDGGGAAGWDECVLEFFLPPDCRDDATRKAAAGAIVATIMERSGGGGMKAVVISGLQDLVFDIAADGECVLRPDPVAMAYDVPQLELNGHGGDEWDSDEEGLHLVVAMGTTTSDIEASKMHHDEHRGGEEDPRSQVGKRATKRKGEKTVSLDFGGTAALLL
jgi:hypothetical protein